MESRIQCFLEVEAPPRELELDPRESGPLRGGLKEEEKEESFLGVS